MKRWWGPRGYTTPFCAIDLRPGGVIGYCLRSPEGRDVWGKGVFRENYGMSPDWPLETLMEVTFDEHAGNSKVTLCYAGVPPGADRDGPKQGWSESLDRLAEYLAKG